MVTSLETRKEVFSVAKCFSYISSVLTNSALVASTTAWSVGFLKNNGFTIISTYNNPACLEKVPASAEAHASTFPYKWGSEILSNFPPAVKSRYLAIARDSNREYFSSSETYAGICPKGLRARKVSFLCSPVLRSTGWMFRGIPKCLATINALP
eukprot:Phypoly_transcript_16970.p1 GENE.Phypoly_transcript_16970~~Phypoly_transcript_16970.p1  ORF type:complete len:154 (-),score=9.72 Phypoly_transcript_16970:180-641(-)